MKTCTSLATALCGRRPAPVRIDLPDARATFPPFSVATDWRRAIELPRPMNTRRDAVLSTSLRSHFLGPFAQTTQPTCRRTWQLEDKLFYSKKVHEHFFNPRNAGAFDMSDPETRKKVGTAIVGKAACGDVIKLQVMVEDGKIKDARFKTFGCGSAIASSSYATELIKGKTCEDALQLKNTDIAEYLSLPPVKVHCSLLAEDAVKHAIKDYQKKQTSLTSQEGAGGGPAAENCAASSAPPSSEGSAAAAAGASPSSPTAAAVTAMNRESAAASTAAQS